MDAAAAAAAVGPRTQALLPVHLYGRLADMQALAALARDRDLQLVEDACQAHGATREAARAGTTGRAGAFSFYPAKNLGAMGDAGALVTDDAELAEAMRALREHGQREKYRHSDVGWTARLDTIHAAVLLRKLPYLDEWNAQRRAAADLYIEGLAGVGDLTLPDSSDRGQVWHLFVVRTLDRDGLADHLAASNIGTGCHYPEPPHLSDAYAQLGYAEGRSPPPSGSPGKPSLFRCSPESQKHRSDGLSRASAPGSTVADRPINDAPYRTLVGVEFGDQVVVQSFTNLYGCSIGDNTRIGPFVEIQRGAVIGASCKIQSHSFICDGVTIEDEVFVGHGVMFVNDKYPRATTADGRLQSETDWKLLDTVVERGATIGSGAVVLGGIRVGAHALVGAGAVVTRDVAPGEVVRGVPARVRSD